MIDLRFYYCNFLSFFIRLLKIILDKEENVMQPIESDERVKALESTIKRLSKHVQKYKRDLGNQKTKSDQQTTELLYAREQIERSRSRSQDTELKHQQLLLKISKQHQQQSQQKHQHHQHQSQQKIISTNATHIWLRKQISRLTTDTALNVAIARTNIRLETKRAQRALSTAAKTIQFNNAQEKQRVQKHFKQLETRHAIEHTSSIFINSILESTTNTIVERKQREFNLINQLKEKTSQVNRLEQENQRLLTVLQKTENEKRIDIKHCNTKYNALEREVVLLRYAKESKTITTQTDTADIKTTMSTTTSSSETQTNLQGDEQWYHWRDARTVVDRLAVEKKRTRKENKTAKTSSTQTNTNYNEVSQVTKETKEESCNTKWTGPLVTNKKPTTESTGTQSISKIMLSLGCQTSLITKKSDSIQLKKNQKNNNEKCDQGNVDNSGTSAMFDTPLRSTVHHKDLTFNTPPTVVQKPLNVLKKEAAVEIATTMVEQLTLLATLKRDDLLSKEEYSAAKRLVLPSLTTVTSLVTSQVSAVVATSTVDDNETEERLNSIRNQENNTWEICDAHNNTVEEETEDSVLSASILPQNQGPHQQYHQHRRQQQQHILLQEVPPGFANTNNQTSQNNWQQPQSHHHQSRDQSHNQPQQLPRYQPQHSWSTSVSITREELQRRQQDNNITPEKNDNSNNYYHQYQQQQQQQHHHHQQQQQQQQQLDLIQKDTIPQQYVRKRRSKYAYTYNHYDEPVNGNHHSHLYQQEKVDWSMNKRR